MATRERPIYTEWSPWPGWIQVVFWGTMIVSIVAVAGSPGMSPVGRMAGLLSLVALLASTQWLVAGLKVRLYQERMELGLGAAGLIHKRVRYEDIEDLESVKYHPLNEFGGWGIRRSGRKRAWTARGDRAVVLHLADGILLYVGSDKPQRLEERIRTVAGTRIGEKDRA
jgi:hypothetical protein